MSKNKVYTKMILERLNRKAHENAQKNDPYSNQKTQATPNDTSQNKIKQIRYFFDNFEENIVTIHEPVVIRQKKPLKRSLFFQLSEISFRKMKSGESTELKMRMVTQPATISQFMLDERKYCKASNNRQKEMKSSIICKKSEEKSNSQNKVIQSDTLLPRYRSLKSIPIGSGTHRRILVNPSPHIQNVRPSDYKDIKIQRKRLSPKKMLRKCQSYQKYFEDRRFF